MSHDKELLIAETSGPYSDAIKYDHNANNRSILPILLVSIVKALRILLVLILVTIVWLVIVSSNVGNFDDTNNDVIENDHSLFRSNCCENIESAKNCNSISYCIDEWKLTAAVLAVTSPSRSEPEICKECMRMVEMARDQLNSNMTREELAEVFRGVCKIYFLHIKPLVKQCDKLVDKYLDEYLEMLISAMDPETICRTALLCPNEYNFTGGCSLCRQYSNLSLAIIDRKPLDKNLKNFNKFLMKTCLAIIQNRSMCVQTLTSKINLQIFENVRDGLRTNAFCEIGSLCYVNNHRHSSPINDHNILLSSSIALNELDDQSKSCQSCQIIVDAVRKSFVRETSPLEFRSIFEQICVHFVQQNIELYTDDHRSLCKHYLSDSTITKIVDQIFFAMNQTNFAVTFCIDSEQCKSRERRREIDFGDSIKSLNNSINLPIERVMLVANQKLSLLSSLPPIEKNPLNFSAILPENNSSLIIKSSSSSTDDKNCVICLLFVESIRNYLVSNKTTDQVEKYMQDVCKTFEIPLQDDCFQFVKNYGPRIVQKIYAKIRPDKICLEFDFCV